jgi:hypothetical protein
MACRTQRVPSHPRARRGCGTPNEVATSAPQFDTDEDGVGFQPYRFRGEDVTSQDLVWVVCEKRWPTCTTP